MLRIIHTRLARFLAKVGAWGVVYVLLYPYCFWLCLIAVKKLGFIGGTALVWACTVILSKLGIVMYDAKKLNSFTIDHIEKFAKKSKLRRRILAVCRWLLLPWATAAFGPVAITACLRENGQPNAKKDNKTLLLTSTFFAVYWCAVNYIVIHGIELSEEVLRYLSKIRDDIPNCCH